MSTCWPDMFGLWPDIPIRLPDMLSNHPDMSTRWHGPPKALLAQAEKR
jgi:hypothetical protein